MRATDVYTLTPVAPYLTNSTITSAIAGLRMLLSDTPYRDLSAETCLQDGPFVLKKFFDIPELGKWECLLVLVSYGVAVRVGYWLVLVWHSHSKRK